MSTGKKLVVVSGIGCGSVGFLLCAGLIVWAFISPSEKATPGSALSAGDRTILKELGVLDDGEEVIYFYSGGLVSITEDGNYFTDKRVVSYEEFGEETTIEQATYAEIADIQPEFLSGWLDDSVITIYREDESEFYLIVSNSDRGDRKFYNRLLQEWKKHKPAAERIAD